MLFLISLENSPFQSFPKSFLRCCDSVFEHNLLSINNLTPCEIGLPKILQIRGVASWTLNRAVVFAYRSDRPIVVLPVLDLTSITITIVNKFGKKC